jgi:putative Mg2+ transporter-C (MgtC) family protein
MPLTLDHRQILLRLLLAAAAGLLLGLNRNEAGHSAGMRTTMLVSLAACIAMLQCNLLLPTAGKNSAMFSVLDLMRLPLGILTGMGFIGAGAILRRGDQVSGLTTAATLWVITVIGLCFGGGQLLLGSISTAGVLFIVWALKPLERFIPQWKGAKLSLVLERQSPSWEELASLLLERGIRIESQAISLRKVSGLTHLVYRVRWRTRPDQSAFPTVFDELSKLNGVASISWSE